MRANSARRRARWLGLGLVALSMGLACAPSVATRHRALHEEWRQSAPSSASAEGDGDRLFAGARTLERNTLIEAVLARNPNLRAARYAWRAALARHPQVSSLDDPMLGVGIAPLSIDSDEVDPAPKFDVSQKLPFPGKLHLAGEAALAEAEAAAHDHAAVRLRLATIASLLYDDYYLARRSLEINDEHLALLEDFQRIATARYEVGEASQQDPIQAEVQVTHAIHRAVLLETAYRIAGEQLNVLMHRAPKAPLPPPPDHLVVPGDAPPAPESLIEAALSNDPTLAAATARTEAEDSRLDLARREYLPDFTLVGSYNRLMPVDDVQPFVGLQLNVPLQLGRRKAAVDEAEARLEAARSRRVAAEDEVRLAVQSGWDRLAEARHIEHLYRDRLLPAARDQVAAARSGFETGRNSFLALIDAERSRLTAELGYEEALANLGRRRAELDRARGVVPGLSW